MALRSITGHQCLDTSDKSNITSLQLRTNFICVGHDNLTNLLLSGLAAIWGMLCCMPALTSQDLIWSKPELSRNVYAKCSIKLAGLTD